MRLVLLLVAVAMLGACAGTSNRALTFVSGDGPNYPATARSDRIEGWVLVEYDVSAEGNVVSPRVVESEPPQVFDQAAIDAVAMWRYLPRVVNGVPALATGVRSRVTFKLGESDEYSEH